MEPTTGQYSLRSNSTQEQRMEQLAALTQRVVKEKREYDLKLELEQKGYIKIAI